MVMATHTIALRTTIALLADARDELAVALYYSEIDPIARDRIVAAQALVRAALDEMIQISRHYTAPHDTPRHATTRTN